MKTKIILELGCNHQGEISLAERMINDAYELGVYGIKLQKRDIESMSLELKNKKRDISNSFGLTYYEHRKALEFNLDEILHLKNYTEKLGLNFSITVFDLQSAKDMHKIGVENIKLPSQLYTDNQLNSYIKSKFNFTAVSTGMHELKEIINNNNFDTHNVLYYCRSLYPCNLKDVDLSKLLYIRSELNNSKLGYSSHDKDGKAIKYAVIGGAEYIERHYTLDKTMKGSDHSTVSSDYKEMENIIAEIKEAEKVLGNIQSYMTEEELKIKKLYRG